MHHLTVSLFFLTTLASALHNCPLQGFDLPPQRNLSGSSIIKGALSNLTDELNQAVKSQITTFGPLNNTNSFSIGIFSTENSVPFFEYNHAPPSIAASTVGTKHLTSDTIYRIGSLSKLITLYAFLVEAGDVHFDEPITTWVPELRAIALASNSSTNPVSFVDWIHVTIGDLASHLGGVGRASSETDLSANKKPIAGLPPLNSSQTPNCGIVPACNRTGKTRGFLDDDKSSDNFVEFFTWFGNRPPVFAPATTPVYSNTGYQLLAYALSQITNTSYPSLLKKSLLTPLNLTHTSVSKPINDSLGLIPSSDLETYYSWALDYQDIAPVGGLYSSISDISILGHSILTSKLLEPATTRRWLHPHAYTSDPTFALGLAWEIRRWDLGYKTVDIYTKSGDTAGYASMLALFPEYGLGFVVLAAGSNAAPISEVLSSLMTTKVIPAIEKSAREAARSRYARKYTSQTAGLNSSITISVDASKPGLGVESWISNSTDMIRVIARLKKVAEVRIRLFPAGLTTQMVGGRIREAWRATFEAAEVRPGFEKGPFDLGCSTWFVVDQLVWGGRALDEFVFVLDEGGENVTFGLEIPALRTVLV